MIGHKLPVIAYLRLWATWSSSSKRKMKMWQNEQRWIHTTEKHITNGEKLIRQVMSSWKEHKLPWSLSNLTQQQYPHKSVHAYATVHKSCFNIRPTLLFCTLKTVLVLYKFTLIHLLVNNWSHPSEFFQQITSFVLKSKLPGWKEPNTEWIWNFTASHYWSCKPDSAALPLQSTYVQFCFQEQWLLWH